MNQWKTKSGAMTGGEMLYRIYTRNLESRTLEWATQVGWPEWTNLIPDLRAVWEATAEEIDFEPNDDHRKEFGIA